MKRGDLDGRTGTTLAFKALESAIEAELTSLPLPFATDAVNSSISATPSDERKSNVHAFLVDEFVNLDELGTPLWPDTNPPPSFTERIDRFGTVDASSTRKWDFWQRWYLSLALGEPFAWELQVEIVQIPDDIWDAGPEVVAEEIERIEATYLAGAVAEDVFLSDRGRLTLVPQSIREAEHLSYLLGSVEDALELAIETGNEVTEESYQARLILRTLDRYANDPQRIELNFERAKASLLEGIAADDLPASPANRDLIQSLADAAGSIRESNPDIARSRDRLNRIRLAEITADEAARIADVAEAVAEVSEDFFKEELAEGIRRLPGVRRDDPVPDAIIPFPTAERNVAFERRDAQILLMARLAKTWLYLKGFDRAELARVMNQPEVQLVGLIGSLASIVGLVAYF